MGPEDNPYDDEHTPCQQAVALLEADNAALEADLAKEREKSAEWCRMYRDAEAHYGERLQECDALKVTLAQVTAERDRFAVAADANNPCWQQRAEDAEQALDAALQRAEQAEAQVAVLAQALHGLLAIRSDSQGVAGYHLNGNVADWDEFPEIAMAGEALANLPAAVPPQ